MFFEIYNVTTEFGPSLVYKVLCSDMCYTEKAPNAWQHKRQETPTINPIGPTNNPHRPSTKHNRKDSPGDA